MAAGLVVAQWQAGLPPSLLAGVLVTAAFIVIELVEALAGFAILGGYLGLRPGLR